MPQAKMSKGDDLIRLFKEFGSVNRFRPNLSEEKLLRNRAQVDRVLWSFSTQVGTNSESRKTRKVAGEVLTEEPQP